MQPRQSQRFLDRNYGRFNVVTDNSYFFGAYLFIDTMLAFQVVFFHSDELVCSAVFFKYFITKSCRIQRA